MVLRKRLDEILAADPQADIVMVGDFNDEPDNVALAKFLRAGRNPKNLTDGALYNTTESIAADGLGTVNWENHWELIDHIIVSPGMLDEQGFAWKAGSSQRLQEPELLFKPFFLNAIRVPSRSYTGNNFHEQGYSDHLPVTCIISD
jgi:hypothetical protein